MALWYMLALTFWAFLAVLVIVFFNALFAIRPWSFGQAGFLLAVAILIPMVAQAALGLQSWTRNLAQSFLVLDEGCMRLRLPGTPEVSIDWCEVTAVKYEKRWITMGKILPFRCRLDGCTITTNVGAFSFTAMEIPSPRRAAQEIAARIGVEI